MAALQNNVFFQYFVCILAVGNIFLMVNSENFIGVGVFIVTAALASFFYSKNIAVILTIAIVLSIVSYIDFIHLASDGFETSTSASTKTVKSSIASLLKDVKVIKRELTT